MYTLKRVLNPEIYQGKYKKNNYFEGWYYKIIDKDFRHILAVIPGVAVNKTNKHSFIQFIDAGTGFSSYISYPDGDFHYSERELDIFINKNHFDKYGMELNFEKEDLTVQGDIRFKDIIPFPKSLFNPGIMGPFSFVPFMECHHGIVNVHSGLNGGIYYNGKYVDFTGGYGYVEKDWGTSFPHSWIWLQSNNFNNGSTSFMFSIASIPWFHKEFDGLIAFLRLDDSFLRFATYTGAKIKELKVDEKTLKVLIEDSAYKLYMEAESGSGGKLKAPKKGIMDVEITESITSVVNIRLHEKNGNLLYEGIGHNTGLELAGNYNKFII